MSSIDIHLFIELKDAIFTLLCLISGGSIACQILTNRIIYDFQKNACIEKDVKKIYGCFIPKVALLFKCHLLPHTQSLTLPWCMYDHSSSMRTS